MLEMNEPRKEGPPFVKYSVFPTQPQLLVILF